MTEDERRKFDDAWYRAQRKKERKRIEVQNEAIGVAKPADFMEKRAEKKKQMNAIRREMEDAAGGMYLSYTHLLIIKC